MYVCDYCEDPDCKHCSWGNLVLVAQIMTRTMTSACQMVVV